MQQALVHDFADAIHGRDEDVDLFGAAMLIARLGNPELDPHRYARQLDEIGEAAREHAGPSRQPEHLAAAVDYQLFHIRGFTGNSGDYGNPSNSYLDAVIDRSTGIPITLSLVYMEIAQRIGLRCEGVGYPGHFVVRCGEPGEAIYVDPFHQGSRLDRQELLAGLESRGISHPSRESLLLPVTRRQLLQRMLNNLRMAYRTLGDTARWRQAIELQLQIEPWNASLVGERGILNYRLGDSDAALSDLQRYVEANEGEATRAGASHLLEQLRTRLRTNEENS